MVSFSVFSQVERGSRGISEQVGQNRVACYSKLLITMDTRTNDYTVNTRTHDRKKSIKGGRIWWTLTYYLAVATPLVALLPKRHTGKNNAGLTITK